MSVINNKTIILKQVERGFNANGSNVTAIVKGQENFGQTTFYCSFLNFVTLYNGEYYFILSNDKTTHCYLLGKEIGKKQFTIDNFSLENGFVATVFVKNDGNKAVAFGNGLSKKLTYKEIMLDYEKNNKENYNDLQSQTQSVCFEKEGERERERPNGQMDKEYSKQIENNIKSSVYDDEVVVTENYFDLKKQVDYINYNKGEYCYANANCKNDVVNSQSDAEKEEKRFSQNSVFDETQQGNGKNAEKVEDAFCENNFFNAVKEDIGVLFEKYPSHISLRNVIPNSKWVKINYNKNNYYVVGVIGKEKLPLYIVYGVQGSLDNKPSNLKNCRFIPESLYQLNGKGYWCMFQNAKNGKTKIN